MAPPQPFRFGLNSINGCSRHAWQETARKAEAFGYSTLVVADHIWTQLAPLTSLVAAAEATTTLRVGSYVFGNDFWHPAVLAREAAPATPSTVPHWRRWATDARVGRARCRYCRSEYANDRRRNIDGRSMTAQAVDQKIDWIRAAAGARFNAIELNILVFINITDDRHGAAAQVATDWGLTDQGLSTDDVLESPYFLYCSFIQSFGETH